MAAKCLILLLNVYFLRCGANEGINFTVSVPKNTEVGRDVASLPSLLGVEKAELPCGMVEGDRYGRFSVSTNCTVVVARPLDWSIQSEYLLKVRVRGLQDLGHLVVGVKVKVSNVLGYPPVYNETCETPVNPAGNRTEDFLFSLSGSFEAVTTAGDVIFLEKTISKPTDNSLTITVENNNCQVRMAIGLHNLNDLTRLVELLRATQQNYRSTISCHAETAAQSELSLALLHFGTPQKYKLNLRYLEEQLQDPQAMEKLQNQPLVYFFSFEFLTKRKAYYTCKLPILRSPVSISNAPSIRHVQTVTLDLNPIGCAPDRYGFLCDRNCICKNGARCHGVNGACKCRDGWHGVACDIPKPGVFATTTPSDPSKIYNSADVTLHCQVHHVNVTTLALRLPNGSEIVRSNSTQLAKTVLNIQSKDNGPYKCQASDSYGNVFNATILLDIVKCPPNRKGELCDESCDCLQGGTCDWRTGCVCPLGWTGSRCNATCPNDTYGEQCMKECRCRNGANCSPYDGKCTCTAGWYGLQCEVPCPKYRYGLRCQLTCTCKNNATCDNVDGSCRCVAPWTGKNCDENPASRSEPLFESLVTVGSIIMLAALVTTILNKKRHLCGVQPGKDGETEALLQLQQVEAGLAQTVRPGWLSRWGTTSRHLTLGHLVGVGMFGHVIQAKLKTAAGDITVAAKEVSTPDSRCYRSFYREAAILVAVHEDQHHDNLRSNIIQLLGLVNESTKKYILMEYASKGNLLWLLRQTRRQNGTQFLPHNLRYAVHIARALQELQRLALTHCDVAARNVLITADDVAKLADFGQARDVYTTVQYVTNDEGDREQPANRDKDNVKNEVLPLNWVSLESLETGEYTCQSDVWSFGVLLWEIATMGREPRYDGNNQPTCHQLAQTLRRGIRLSKPPYCSGEMYDVMMSCWRENPSERPCPDGIEKKLMQMITEKETRV
ncbi:uncharacterized protein [Branchiostoma lanceolatum]|uniref:uncharacterized protein n=1 Tax=Branchiostoma lanceolatum TaxID=7740 RepID=UPI003455AEB3